MTDDKNLSSTHVKNAVKDTTLKITTGKNGKVQKTYWLTLIVYTIIRSLGMRVNTGDLQRTAWKTGGQSGAR
jgi:hypothetical protein